MKIIEVIGKRKVKAILLTIAVLAIGGIAYLLIPGEELHDQTVVKAAEMNSETGSKAAEPSETEQSEQKDQKSGTEKKNQETAKSNNAKQQTSAATSAPSQHTGKSDSNTGSQTPDDKSQPSKPTAPTHVHDYKVKTGTREESYQQPIIGDRCNSCDEVFHDPKIEQHIMETSCTGYSTDVVVGYETVTETVTYTYYECSCGARKDS